MRSSYSIFARLLVTCSVLWLVACGEQATPVADAVTDAPVEAATTVPVVSPTATPLPLSPTTTPIPPSRRAVEVVVVTVTGSPASAPPPGDSPQGEKIGETRHFDFYAQDGYFPVAMEEWKEQTERVYAYVNQRTGKSVTEKIALSFSRPESGPCRPRGSAVPWQSPPVVTIYADEQTSQEQLLAVLAHEVGHVIQAHGFEGDLAYARGLSEGFANWASQRYWNRWQGTNSFDDSVSKFVEEGIFLPLHKNNDLHNVYPGSPDPPQDCLAQRDLVYTEWASFVTFLIDGYGMETFAALLRTTAPESEETADPGTITPAKPPNYEAVYGRSFEELTADWRQRVRDGE